MAQDTTVLYSLLGVLLILFAVLMYNNSKAKRETGGGTANSSADDEGLDDSWLLKFVRHDGNVVGETVARDGARLILKQGKVYKSVAASMMLQQGDELVVDGFLDWDAAIAQGATWHAANTAGQDNEITADLTRSEDVKHPALRAMKSNEAASTDHDSEDEDADSAASDARSEPEDASDRERAADAATEAASEPVVTESPEPAADAPASKTDDTPVADPASDGEAPPESPGAVDSDSAKPTKPASADE